MEKEPISTLNSPLRTKTQKILDPLVNQLKKIPGISANHITFSGLALVGLGSLEKTLKPNSLQASYIALALMALGISTDAFDGALARSLNQSSENGAILDLLSDRTQESILSLSRITTASLRKDPFGVITASLSGLTNPLPSLLRAKAEKKSLVVPESGKNPLTFLGTRASRAVVGVFNTTFPTVFEVSSYSSQSLIDGLSTLANILTSLERFFFLKDNNSNVNIQNNDNNSLKTLGKKKEKALDQFILINTLVILSAGTIGLINSLSRD